VQLLVFFYHICLPLSISNTDEGSNSRLNGLHTSSYTCIVASKVSVDMYGVSRQLSEPTGVWSSGSSGLAEGSWPPIRDSTLLCSLAAIDAPEVRAYDEA
jgi:hypothetical protein